jgi:diguanylate cyclase (GGDEF)-like protein
VNDSLGHAAGDQLLGAAAQRLRAGARPGDTVARLGGDEFAILLDGLADATEAEAVAAALAAAMEDPFPVGGREAMVTTSIGVAVAHPGQATPADLLRDADVALHRAKERGKARYAVFDAAMGASLRDRAALEADLRRAVGRGELRLVYQPIVELATGRVVGAEALARWDHPTRGELLPGAFVPIAEEAGLVGPLGQWVLDAVCRQGRAWQDALPAPLVLSVNVSADQFRQTDLVEVVAGALRETGLAPDRLQLEITEGAAMGDADEAVSTLRRLKGLGVRLAIDDFGTGYSSLAYLQRFPLDLLKVDRRFVAGLGRNEGDTAIVAAVLGLARTLGLRVVAEGVETREQANRLQALDCELGQGYLFGRPASAEAFEALLGSVSFALPRRA